MKKKKEKEKGKKEEAPNIAKHPPLDYYYYLASHSAIINFNFPHSSSGV